MQLYVYGLVKNYNYNIIQKHTIFVIFFRFCDANIYIHGSGTCKRLSDNVYSMQWKEEIFVCLKEEYKINP